MPDTVHLGSGKVRELYALGEDRLLLVASDRISTFDVVLPTEIPDKGRVLTGLAAFWFARTPLDRPQPPPRAPAGRALDGVPAAHHAADRVRGARLPRGLRLERLPDHRRGLRAPAPRRAASSPSACPSRSSLRPPRRRPATTRTSRAKTPRGSWAPRPSRPPSASRSRSTGSPRGTRSTAASSSPTRSSSSAPARTGGSSWATRPSRPIRRDSGRPTSTPPAVRSRPSTSSSCAISASRRAGTRPIQVPRCPPMSSRGRGRATSRPSSASPASALPTTSAIRTWCCPVPEDASGAGRP